MNKNYQIRNNNVDIYINSEIYPLSVIKKASANFLNDYYIIITENNNEYIVNLKPQNEPVDLERTVGEFYNELLRESIRYDISKDTKNIRELLFARALYTTCLDSEEEQIEDLTKDNFLEEKNYELDDIAVNWFDKYDKDED